MKCSEVTFSGTGLGGYRYRQGKSDTPNLTTPGLKTLHVALFRLVYEVPSERLLNLYLLQDTKGYSCVTDSSPPFLISR
jgi:hypothetical protein